jgi:hypothetical protein
MHRIVIAAGVLALGLTGIEAAQSQERDSSKLEEIFKDNFENGIRKDWVMIGDNFSVVNGHLNASGIFTAHVGDVNWEDYVVEFQVIDLPMYSEFGVVVRRQSDEDYMALHVLRRPPRLCILSWITVRNGMEQELVNSKTEIKDRDRSKSSPCTGDYKIEVLGNTYRVYRNNRMAVSIASVSQSSSRGNVGLIASKERRNSFVIDNFNVSKVANLP